jgi:hypothetical protein
MITGAADANEDKRIVMIQFALKEKPSFEGVSIMTRTNTLIKVVALVASLFVILFAAAAATDESPKIDASTPVEELKALASQGNADAMLELGERLIQGQGVETNVAEGMQWLYKAADAGQLKSKETIQQEIAQWFKGWQPKLDEKKAIERAAFYMKSMPAWAEK